MKILMILSNLLKVDPRVYKEAEVLINNGHEVAVIVWDRRKKYSSVETIDNISVYRVYSSLLMRILPYDLLRIPFWWRKAYKKAKFLYSNGYRFDVVHCHDLDTLQVGIWLKRKFGIKLIYDAHELWGYMIRGEVPNFISRSALRFEKRLCKYVDHIITVDDPFKNYFRSISDKPITIVMNCKDLEYEDYEFINNKVFTLIYIGGMKKKRFFPQIIDVVGEIGDIRLILAGKKTDMYFELQEYSKKYDCVDFLGTVYMDEILPRTWASDATFILVDPSSIHYQRTVFNKQFEAMVCGRPIIVTKGTYAAKMTEELKCGLTVEYNKESIKEAIIKLRDDPKLCERLGRNAMKAAKERYNWMIEKEKLLELYSRINDVR